MKKGKLIHKFAFVNAIVQPICAVIMFYMQIYVYRMCIAIIRIMEDMSFLTSNLPKVALTFCLVFSFFRIFRVVPVSYILNQVINHGLECDNRLVMFLYIPFYSFE